MIRINEDAPDEDDRLGEAVEAYLTLVEEGEAPDPDAFVANYPEIVDDLRAALEGLDMVRGLVGATGKDLEAGRRIAGYKIVRELGRGGMGVVYEAVHVDLDRPVALKVLGTHAAPDSTGRRRFLNEAKTAAGLHHTHIVPVFDVGQVGGLCYYAMQRIEGSGLDRVLRALRRDRSTAAGSGSNRRSAATTPRNPAYDVTASWNAGRLAASRALSGGRGVDDADPAEDDTPPPFEPPKGSAYHRWVARLGRQAAEALAHAHSRGIIHRDIKPSNLLVDARGTVWVADFGLSRRLAEIDPGLTRTDTRPGTPRYMSPEQTRCDPVDGRTDVYGLGATLYEMLALRPPFDGKNAVELARQVVEREAPPPRRFDRRIPRDLETIVLKAMAKRPSDRYGSAQELADDLGRFLATEPVRARRIGPLGRTWRLARRHPALSAVSTSAVLTIVAVATTAYVQVARERDRAVQAEGQMQKALRQRFLSEATVVRTSTVPNRRERGLDLIRQAAALGPEADLARRLRDEAVDFLALRDVVARPPDLAVGPIQDMEYVAADGRLATISEDGHHLDLWDANGRQRLAHHALWIAPEAAPAEPTPAPTNPTRRRSASAIRIAPAGPGTLAVIRPDEEGVRLVDLASGALREGPRVPGRRVVSILASAAAKPPRLVTVETESRGPEAGGRGPQPTGNPGRPEGPFRGRSWVRLWDLESPEAPMMTLVSPEDWDGRGMPGLPSAALSPDGSTVATARLRFDGGPRNEGRPGDDLPIVLWSAQDGGKLGQIALGDDYLTSLALGPQGLLAAAGGGTIRLWNVRDPKAPNPLPSLGPHLSGVSRLRFSPSGTLLAASGFGSGVEVWDLASEAPAATLPTGGRVVGFSFSPEGHHLAVAHGERGDSASFWQIVEPRGRVRLQESRPNPTALAFNPSGDLVISNSRDPLRIWSPGDCPTAPRQLPGVRGSAIAFDTSGRPETPESADLPSPSEGRGPEGRGRPGRGPQGEEGGRPITPDSRGNQNRGNQNRGPSGRGSQGPQTTGIVRSKVGGITVVTRAGESWIRRDGGPWKRLRTPLDSEPPTFPIPWRVLAISPAGDRLYFGNPIAARAFSLSGYRAAPLPWEMPHEVTALGLSPDGRSVALGNNSGVVSILDAASGRSLATLLPPDGDGEDRISSIAFSPAGGMIAVGSRGRVRLWNIAGEPLPLLRLPGHRNPIRILTFSPDGRRLATSSDDPVVEVWDLAVIRRELEERGIGW